MVLERSPAERERMPSPARVRVVVHGEQHDAAVARIVGRRSAGRTPFSQVPQTTPYNAVVLDQPEREVPRDDESCPCAS